MSEQDSPLPIMNGDHAEFEAEWAGRPKEDRPDWPYPSFDGRDWAKAFCKVANAHGYKAADGSPISEDFALSWFCNALMRGFDEAHLRAMRDVGRSGWLSLKS